MAEISDYLNGLEERVVQEEKQICVVENPNRVVDVFFEIFNKDYWMKSVKEAYDVCLEDVLKRFKDQKYSQKDINEFLIKIGQRSYQKWHKNNWITGLLISALINASEEDDFEIFTQHLTTPISALGHKNKKNVTILGSAGDGLGNYMTEGSIIVNGSTDGATGASLLGGTIWIKGDTRRGVGICMRRGKIIIEGNAGCMIGEQMTGGEIHLNGSYEEMGDIRGGKVYHKNKFIKGSKIRNLYMKLIEKWS